MNNRTEQLDYDNLEAIIQKARMERSAAVGDAIANVLSAMLLAIGRAFNAIKSVASGAKSTRGAAGFDAPAHR